MDDAPGGVVSEVVEDIGVEVAVVGDLQGNLDNQVCRVKTIGDHEEKVGVEVVVLGQKKNQEKFTWDSRHCR